MIHSQADSPQPVDFGLVVIPGAVLPDPVNVTSKGQVTIPQRIRHRFGFKPGTAVEFVIEGNKVVLRSKRRSKSVLDAWLDEATGFLRGPSTDERMRLTRGDGK